MSLSENPTLEEIIDETERLNNLIVDRGGAKTITPKTTNQVLSKGNYKGDITVIGDADLIASNIRSGKNIFGVNGTLVEGKRLASGVYNTTIKGQTYASSPDTPRLMGTIPFSLGFVPTRIIVYCSDYNGTALRVSIDSAENYNTDTGIGISGSGSRGRCYIANLTKTGVEFWVNSIDAYSTGSCTLTAPLKWIAIE